VWGNEKCIQNFNLRTQWEESTWETIRENSSELKWSVSHCQRCMVSECGPALAS
jgi:hypothetical protein